MIIRDQDNYVELSLVEVDGPPAGYGDGHFHIKVSAHGFSGESFVWVKSSEFHSFASRLRSLKEKGSALMLESMSPHEFKLMVRILDKTGDLAIEGELRRNVFIHSRRRRVENRLVFVLDLDLEHLERVIEDIKQIQTQFPLS